MEAVVAVERGIGSRPRRNARAIRLRYVYRICISEAIWREGESCLLWSHMGEVPISWNLQKKQKKCGISNGAQTSD